MRTCDEVLCEGAVLARGLCRKHYRQRYQKDTRRRMADFVCTVCGVGYQASFRSGSRYCPVCRPIAGGQSRRKERPPKPPKPTLYCESCSAEIKQGRLCIPCCRLAARAKAKIQRREARQQWTCPDCGVSVAYRQQRGRCAECQAVAAKKLRAKHKQ